MRENCLSGSGGARRDDGLFVERRRLGARQWRVDNLQESWAGGVVTVSQRGDTGSMLHTTCLAFNQMHIGD